MKFLSKFKEKLRVGMKSSRSKTFLRSIKVKNVRSGPKNVKNIGEAVVAATTSHPSFFKTYRMLRVRFSWNGLNDDV